MTQCLSHRSNVSHVRQKVDILIALRQFLVHCRLINLPKLLVTQSFHLLIVDFIGSVALWQRTLKKLRTLKKKIKVR